MMTKSDDLQMQSGPSSKTAGKRIEDREDEFTHDSWNIVPSESQLQRPQCGRSFQYGQEPVGSVKDFESSWSVRKFVFPGMTQDKNTHTIGLILLGPNGSDR